MTDKNPVNKTDEIPPKYAKIWVADDGEPFQTKSQMDWHNRRLNAAKWCRENPALCDFVFAETRTLNDED